MELTLHHQTIINLINVTGTTSSLTLLDVCLCTIISLMCALIKFYLIILIKYMGIQSNVVFSVNCDKNSVA
jgi:hypothetical protein